ncbi:MAG: hypothetical protein R3B48_11515 [Kofleriaceae bacterium]
MTGGTQRGGATPARRLRRGPALGVCVAALASAVTAVVADDRAPPPVPASADAPWRVELSARVELVPGDVGAVALTLSGRGRYGVARAGVLIDLVAPEGLSVRQRRYHREDAVDPEAAAPAFSIPVRAEAPGSYALTVRARFWVCSPKHCLPVELRRVVEVVAIAPAVDAGADAAPSPAPPPARDKRKSSK